MEINTAAPLLPDYITQNPEFRHFHKDRAMTGLASLQSGTHVNVVLEAESRMLDGVELPTSGLLYWLEKGHDTLFRLTSWDDMPGIIGDRNLGTGAYRVVSALVLAPSATPVPIPPAPPFQWPNENMKNLVAAAPASPYTRALLRVKFNVPIPPEAVTLEAIEAFLKDHKPVVAAPPAVEARPQPSTLPPRPPASLYSRRRAEIDRGEYIAVTGRIDGYTYATEHWTQEATVRVPLSVFEDGEDEVDDYVRSEVSDADRDYGDTDYGDSEVTDFEIDACMSDVMQEAEDKIAERDGTTNNEDEE